MEILSVFSTPTAWLALVMLIFMEIVLGIDNIVFLSIMTGRLPEKQQPKARFIGLTLAMIARIVLLFGISLLMRLTQPFWGFQIDWISASLSGQSLIVLFGGLFLIYKSVSEIHLKLEEPGFREDEKIKVTGFWRVILQIVALDIIFSFDSVLTAVGMVSFQSFGYAGAMAIIISAIVISVAIMITASGPVSRFVNKHPTVQMLALSFLLLIGVMLLVDAAHLSNLTIFGAEVNDIPKGYIYFAISFSLLVEVLNLKRSRRVAAAKEKRQGD